MSRQQGAVIISLLVVLVVFAVGATMHNAGKEGRCEQHRSDLLLNGDPANPPTLPEC